MKPSSTGGCGRVADYRWFKRWVVRTRAKRAYTRFIKRAAHRADRQAARSELHGYVDERYDD